MEKTIEKLQKLQLSAQKLETHLSELWNLIDQLGEDNDFGELMDKVQHLKTQDQISNDNMNDLREKMSEFDNAMGQIPENGTAAASFEDAISDLIEWINKNK